MKASRKYTIIVATSLLSLLIIFLAVNYFIWHKNYRGRFYPQEFIGNLAVGGKTKDEAKGLLEGIFQKINQTGLTFQYNQEVKRLDLDIVSFDSDLARPTLILDASQTITDIFNSKNHNSFFSYLWSKFVIGEQKFSPSYSLDETAVKSFLEDSFSELNIPPENAYFSLTSSQGSGQIIANQEKIGKGIDYDKVFNDVKNNLANLDDPTVLIRTISLYPEIKQADLSHLTAEAEKMVGQGGLTISFNESEANNSTIKYWKIGPDKLATWISLIKTLDGTSIYLDQEKIKKYLEAEASPEINKAAVLPRFEIKDDKVSSWQTGKDGREVDLDASAQAITQNIINGQTETNLIMKNISAQDESPDNNLQIKEIIGTGHSSFTGSPSNRRKNIQTGANALQGILIKPNEEFSLIKTLGAIDASAGYLPELVIKDNKTVPEFGGGLCQIGTTIFRTALSSGLPITMRQNHSYRVSYYEPAGTDATIYDPLPDFRFINDTGNYILIQARIENNDLYFDFWGTKDGRVATTTYPTIYNIVKPAPTKIVETTELAPGQKKCTESSHNGADAFFDYTVIYPEGATTTPVQERRFSSHYVPWQGVCLVGVAASSTSEIVESASDPIATSSDQTRIAE